MIDRPNSWKSFYRETYSRHWQTFSQELGHKVYHVRYQERCLAPVKEIENGRILEVGCGRGDLLAQYPPASNERVGCDLSEGNIIACSERFQETDPSVKLVHSDAENLPFANRYFDAVYSLSVLWYLPDSRRAIDEMFRVTKPGGLVLFDTLNTWHVTSLANHWWRKACRVFGRELGRTSLSSASQLIQTVQPWASEFHVYGNYLFLPVGLPVLKEAGNWCRFFPSLAYAMSEGPARVFSHKLLVVARKK